MCRRKAGAPEPVKFLGHGIVDNVSRSVTLSSFVSTAAEISEATLGLYHSMAVPAEQVKGVGIVVSKLDSSSASAAAAPRYQAPAKAVAGALFLNSPRRVRYLPWLVIIILF